MKVGDLVKLQFQGNGQPEIGVIYESTPARYYEGEVEHKCLWDVPLWNDTFWREHELLVVNESG